MFHDILDKKQAFADYKNIDFRKSPNWICPKGLVHDFGQKFRFFLCLYSGKIVLEIAFGDVLDRTQAFLHYKNIDF